MLFYCMLRYHNGKAQFYITDLELCCGDHVRLFTESNTISTLSRSTNLCSKQSCLKFLRSLHCSKIRNAQTFKDLGVVFRDCKHLKTIEFVSCGSGICALLDQIPNSRTCLLKINFNPADSLTSVEAEKLSGVLPRFNVTPLDLQLFDCCAAAVNKLVCSITLKTLQLKKLKLTGVDESILQVEEMEALFGRINEAFSALEFVSLGNFNARGNLAPLTKRVHFFPNLVGLGFSELNIDER